MPAAPADPIFLTALGEDSGGQFPSSIAAGDFNHDGKIDLAVTNSGSSNVAILLSNGDGTYQPAVTYSTGVNPSYVTVADLNGDGTPDLAVGSGWVVDVLLGNGDGTFRAAASYNSGGLDTLPFAFGDFNHDGRIDLAIPHTCADSNCVTGSVSILIGNGDGTFMAPTSYGSGGDFARSVGVGDFNGDGKLDIAVGNGSSSASHDEVGILLGNGDGTFQAAVSYDAGGAGDAAADGFSPSIALGDFNSDGKVDLAVADFGNCEGSKTSCYQATLNVLLGNGDGTFQAVVSYDVGSNASDVISGDVNGDGKLDLIVTNFCGVSDCGGDEGTVSVLLGNGDGTLQPAIAFDATVGNGAISVVAGDFNQDGRLDLAIGNQASLCCSDGSVGILLGNGDGTFQTTSSFSTGAYGAWTAVAGDFNGDGKLDLAVGSNCNDADACASSAMSVLSGNGDGTFVQSGIYRYPGGESGSSVAMGDFNNDGKLDLVATGSNGNSGSNNLAGVSVFLGNGDGTFQAPVVYSSDGLSATWVGVGDFNGDGKLDLAVAHGCADSSCANGSISILLGNGNGTFQAPLIDSSVGELSSFVIGDFNHDGKLDLAAPEFVCTLQACSGSFIVGLGNGDGSFQPAVTYDTGGLTPLSVATADFNADGKPDLAVMNQCTSSNDCTVGIIGILLGNGDGTFQAATTYSTSATAGYLAVADFNGDGKIDLLISADNSVEVMLGNGDGSLQAPTNYLAGGVGNPAVGDFNRDGQPDLEVPSLDAVNILTNIAAGFRYVTSTVVTSSANPAVVGQSITFTATVSGAVSGSPTGAITFADGGTSLGSAPLNAGKATLTTTLSSGSHAISSAYGGDSTFLASTSSSFMETVNAEPDFSLSGLVLTPDSVQPGGSSIATVQVNGVNGFSGSVSLACSVTPASATMPTCSVSPASIVPGTTATLTVTTTGPAVSATLAALWRHYALLLPLMGFAVTGVWSLRRKPRHGKHSAIPLGCLLFIALTLLVACGRNQSSGSQTNQTPGGMYTVTVTGASSGSVQHSITTTLAVQ